MYKRFELREGLPYGGRVTLEYGIYTEDESLYHFTMTLDDFVIKFATERAVGFKSFENMIEFQFAADDGLFCQFTHTPDGILTFCYDTKHEGRKSFVINPVFSHIYKRSSKGKSHERN